MSLSVVDDVAELRAAYAAQPPGTIDTTLTTLAEHIGFLIFKLRSIGADEAELLHHIEVVLTALSTCREDLLEAEAELRQLGYVAISSTLRRLARRAPPRPSTWREKYAHRIVKL